MSPNWRWRRCPSCEQVARASDFEPLEPEQGWGMGAVQRRCPRCWYVGRTREFPIVRERHTERYLAARRAE
jgi:hypothetical protein